MWKLEVRVKCTCNLQVLWSVEAVSSVKRYQTQRIVSYIIMTNLLKYQNKSIVESLSNC